MFRAMHLSFHSTTQMEIPRQFLEIIDVQLEREDNDNCLVRLG